MLRQGRKVREVRDVKGRGQGRAASLGVFGVALWLVVGGLFAAPAAQAATGGCEGRMVKALPFVTGEVRVYKSRDRVCAVTVALRAGERRHMSVSIQPRGGVPVGDAGQFTRYAGPVSVGAINRCVYVKGGVAAGSVDSGWILC
ncbi:hypothetical protein M2167_001926 [Streptomyces sp. SPB4]|nr:hypothetical protein [Streptomyces sp. SPB4]